MASDIRTDGESSNSTPPPPARRSARNRRSTPLVESFTNYVERTPPSEVEDLSNQLHNALGALANSNIPSPSTQQSYPKLGGVGGGLGGLSRSKSSKATTQAATSAGRMLLDRPTSKRSTISSPFPSEVATGNNEEEQPSASGMKTAASAGQLTLQRLPRNDNRANRQFATSMAPAIPDWKGYYAPKSSSRRNSRAGSELSIKMKISAQQALAELGEISDDDDLDDDDWLNSYKMEETVVEIIREGSESSLGH